MYNGTGAIGFWSWDLFICTIFNTNFTSSKPTLKTEYWLSVYEW